MISRPVFYSLTCASRSGFTVRFSASLPPPPSSICINLCHHRVCSRQSKMMLIERSGIKASRCNAVLFITMACFCLQEGRSEGSKHDVSTLQMVISNHFIDIWPINTIGNVHDASQCADSYSRLTLDSPGNCCGLDVNDRQCRDGYKVSSVPFEECQKTDEGCSFANSCFSCVLSPSGKDSPHPVPVPLHEIIRSSQE
jgi:hypothetical protein